VCVCARLLLRDGGHDVPNQYPRRPTNARQGGFHTVWQPNFGRTEPRSNAAEKAALAAEKAAAKAEKAAEKKRQSEGRPNLPLRAGP